jgi:hypothetical protein
MISFLNDKFKKLGKSQFIKNAALLCLIADALNLFYIQFYWLKVRFSEDFLRSVLAINGVNAATLRSEDVLSYKYLLVGSLSNVLVGFIVVHAFIYFLFYKRKKWTAKYIGGYTLSAVLLTILELIVFRNDLSSWSLFLISSALIYGYVFLGIKYFKIQER